MPGITPILKELGIEVVSARESCSQRWLRNACCDDRDPSQYLKTKAMKRVIKKFYNDKKRQRCWKNIISIGDSQAERRALQDLVFRHKQHNRHGEFVDCCCKTLLMIENPSLHAIRQQLRIVTDAMSELVHYGGDIDIDLDSRDLYAPHRQVDF